MKNLSRFLQSAAKNRLGIVKPFFRLYAYSVVSTPISVIYFGGYHYDEGPNDIVAEYKNLNWNRLGTLASGRYGPIQTLFLWNLKSFNFGI